MRRLAAVGFASNTKGVPTSLAVTLVPFSGVGRYGLCASGYAPRSASAYYWVLNPDGTSNQSQVWASGPACSGTAVVQSFDSVQHTISGTFQFTAVNASDSSTVSVTAGTFNGTYLPN